MANDFTIRPSQADMMAFKRTMKRAIVDLGKTDKEARIWGGRVICDALANSTTKSKTKRPIVKNPLFATDPKAMLDNRRGIWGVMKYIRFGNGAQKFDPIYRGGEFGAKIKWVEKNGVMLRTSGGKWEKFTREDLAAYGAIGAGLEIKDHPKTKIGRSGMAKKAWQWAKKFVRSGGTASIFGVPKMAEVFWMGSDKSTLVLRSNLRYAMDALKGKGSELNGIIGKAATLWDSRITKKLYDIGAR
jgi:hypothetical protein